MTSVTCKLMESIIRDHVLNYFMRNRLFSDRQYGFVKGRSTTLQLFRILDDWTNSIDSGDQIDCMYIYGFRESIFKCPMNVLSVNYHPIYFKGAH